MEATVVEIQALRMARLVVTPMVMNERIELLTMAAVNELAFDEIIDVRAPEEYAVDHVTGAINLPVLDNDERVRVGTLHQQVSAFEAKKVGASLVSSNIARHLKEHFAKYGKSYRPLIYCFRGGQRSRSLATVLCEVGWRPAILEGGYKAYRAHVMEGLGVSAKMRWRVLNGLTGSGKTLVLHALAERGAQVLDLEGLANHKGSLFGGDLENPQPSQKHFETLIHDQLKAFDPERTVFVEAESPKIGHLNIPGPLWTSLRPAPVIEVNSPVEARAQYLYGDYASWRGDSERILGTIERLRPFQSKEQIERWISLCHAEDWIPFVETLLTEHYDKRYGAGGSGHYEAPSQSYELANQEPASIVSCAEWLLEQVAAWDSK